VTFILALLRFVFALGILGASAGAVLALLGFAIPVLDLLNHLQMVLFFATLLGAVGALLLGMRWAWKALALIGLAASAWTYGPEWLSAVTPREAVAGTTIKVMSHNVFGLNYELDRVDDAIEAEDPDIVVLQEFFPEQAGLIDLLKVRYPYWVRCQGGKRANLGLFSKMPFTELMTPADCPSRATGSQRTAHIIAGYQLEDGTSFSMMTTHMDWPYPIERQADQMSAAAEAIRALEGPLVVAGDFNSTPWSYALKRFEEESGLTRETRNLITYPVLFGGNERLIRTLPFLPLDQVFQRGVTINSLHSSSETGSDHLPVVFSFVVTPSP
jgi:endonuclease/exonuclease/phosphatase (EEP) superfamily protein YafD